MALKRHPEAEALLRDYIFPAFGDLEQCLLTVSSEPDIEPDLLENEDQSM